MKKIDNRITSFRLLITTAVVLSSFPLSAQDTTSQLNSAIASKQEAYALAQRILGNKGTIPASFFSNFDRNLSLLQKKLKLALDIPRIQMPVIEPTQMDEFQKRLQQGELDIFKPYVTRGNMRKMFENNGKYVPFPTNLKNNTRGRIWLKLGTLDGDALDDRIAAKIEYVPAKNLIPTQSQIWFDKILNSIAQYGLPKKGSPVLETTIIISKDNYILDGHHRFGQALLTDPNLKMRALRVPLDIKTLLKLSASYGDAIGNERKP